MYRPNTYNNYNNSNVTIIMIHIYLHMYNIIIMIYTYIKPDDYGEICIYTNGIANTVILTIH